MKKYEEQKHFLSLMAKVGDYIFIDISKLDISNGYYPSDLADIDSFTINFSKEEIVDSIRRSNLCSEKYLNGKLVIADNQKHNPLEVVDKVFYNNFKIQIYLSEIIKNKIIANNVVNKFASIAKDNKLALSFKDAIKYENINEAVDIIFSLPYLASRKLVVYLLEMRNKEIKEIKSKERKREINIK